MSFSFQIIYDKIYLKTKKHAIIQCTSLFYISNNWAMKNFSGLTPGNFSAIYKKCATVAPPIFPMVSISKQGRKIHCLISESCQAYLPLGIIFITVILRSSSHGPILPGDSYCTNKLYIDVFFSIMPAKTKLMKINNCGCMCCRLKARVLTSLVFCRNYRMK